MYFKSKETKQKNTKTKEEYKDTNCWDMTRKSTQRHIPENLLIQQNRCENV